MSKQNKKIEEVSMKEGVVLENLESEIDAARKELEKTKCEIEEKKQEVKKISAREVDAEEMIIVKKNTAVSVKNQGLKDKIEKQKIYDNEPVTGKFINRRSPGQSAKITYMKYEDDPVKWYTFEDGKVYTIPRGFAEQINDYYHTPNFVKRDGPMDPSAPSSQIHEVDTSNKKYAFVPTRF